MKLNNPQVIGGAYISVVRALDTVYTNESSRSINVNATFQLDCTTADTSIVCVKVDGVEVKRVSNENINSVKITLPVQIIVSPNSTYEFLAIGLGGESIVDVFEMEL